MKLGYLLVGSVIGAAALAVSGFRSAPQPDAHAAPIPARAADESIPPIGDVHDSDQAAEEPATTVIEGPVLETINVSSYTYVRVQTEAKDGVWCAVPLADLAKGARVRVVNAIEMQQFTSSTLHRTFDSIYFGTLEGASAKPGAIAKAGAPAKGGPAAKTADKSNAPTTAR